MNTLYVNKTSDTSADTLLVLGIADLMRAVLRCLGKSHVGIIIRDIGDSFELEFPCTLRREELQSEESISFLDPLISAKPTTCAMRW